MDSTFTFNDVNNRYQLTVKRTFLEVCPDPSNYNVYDLNNEFLMFKYLHNPDGPAVIRFKDGRIEFWIDGLCPHRENPELVERMKKKMAFKEKLAETLS